MQHAVSMLLFHVGENLSQLRSLNQEEFSRAPESWHELVGLRNIIAHGYQAIEPHRIWTYLQDDLDEFRDSVETALDKIAN